MTELEKKTFICSKEYVCITSSKHAIWPRHFSMFHDYVALRIKTTSLQQWVRKQRQSDSGDR